MKVFETYNHESVYLINEDEDNTITVDELPKLILKNEEFKVLDTFGVDITEKVLFKVLARLPNYSESLLKNIIKTTYACNLPKAGHLE